MIERDLVGAHLLVGRAREELRRLLGVLAADSARGRKMQAVRDAFDATEKASERIHQAVRVLSKPRRVIPFLQRGA